MKKINGVFALLLITMSGFVQAKEGPTLGIDLGARFFTGSNLSGAVDPGPAVALNAAWGITDFFSIRGQWLGSMHIGEGVYDSNSTVGFTGGNIGFGSTLNADGKFQPIIETGIGIYMLSTGDMMDRWNITDEIFVSWGANINAGIDYFIKDNVSIGFRIGYIYIPFPAEQNIFFPTSTTSYRQNKILDGGNVSFGINVSYHFGKLMEHMHHMMHGGCMMKHGKEKEEKNGDTEEDKH